MTQGETVCVTGASGYIGSWLVMRLLERGYIVRATILDLGNEAVRHLLELPNASSNLTLWKADLEIEGSFDEAIQGCAGVFHIAAPTLFHSKDPEKEIIQPTVNGVLNVMRSCKKAKTVRRVVCTSSAGAVCMLEKKRIVYDETCWSDIDFCRSVPMNRGLFYLAKTLLEKTAWDFAKENNLNLVTIVTTLVVGPFLTPTIPASVLDGLAPVTGNEDYYNVLKECHFIHPEDISNAHIFLYEHPKAQGRYIANACDASIFDVAKFLREEYPEFNVPTKFKDFDEKELKGIKFSSKKLKDLGFQYKYGFKDMYTQAIESCKAKGYQFSAN